LFHRAELQSGGPSQPTATDVMAHSGPAANRPASIKHGPRSAPFSLSRPPHAPLFCFTGHRLPLARRCWLTASLIIAPLAQAHMASRPLLLLHWVALSRAPTPYLSSPRFNSSCREIHHRPRPSSCEILSIRALHGCPSIFPLPFVLLTPPEVAVVRWKNAQRCCQPPPLQ
jgi:hypothetical protein